jgi:hypothetical protein
MLEPESFFRLEENQCATFSTKKGDIHLDIFLKKAREFKDLYRRSEKRLIYHIQVPVANLELLLELKENSGREIDQGDILLIRKRLSLA